MDSNSIQILFNAIKTNNIELLVKINSTQPLINLNNPHPALGCNLVEYAAIWGRTNILDWLINTCQFPKTSLTEVNSRGTNAILLATQYNQKSVLALARSFDIDLTTQKNVWGHNPVLIAASYGHLDLLQWLTKQGSSLKARCNLGLNPYLHAVQRGHVPVAQWLEQQTDFSFNERDNFGTGAMLLASANGDLKMMKHLHRIAPYCLGEVNSQEQTPALCAAMGGHSEALHFLLQMEAFRLIPSAPINANLQEMAKASIAGQKMEYGYNVVLIAALHGRLNLMKWLSEQGFDFSCQTYFGTNALHCAIQSGSLETVQWLVIKKGFQPDEQSMQYSTKLEITSWLHDYLNARRQKQLFSLMRSDRYLMFTHQDINSRLGKQSVVAETRANDRPQAPPQ